MITLNKPTDGEVAAYEEMRSQVLAGSPGGVHFGMVLLLREGIASWIERCVTSRRLAAQSEAQAALKPLPVDRLHTEIVHVLADIALKHREEMKP